MDILIESVSLLEKEVLGNLMEKYGYEFSQYESTDVDNNGLYGYKDLEKYITKENGDAYFIKVNDKLAGFVMVNDHMDTHIEVKYSIEEFFVMYKYKKLGIGTYVIKYIFNKYKGKWQITYAQKNKPANNFWNKIVKNYTNGNYEKIEDHKKYNDGIIRDKLVFDT
jgi:predicted acetyltransferase